ncbi:MAG: isochorismatase family protein [Dehalococcoidales bacterium]|nr:isochorismatase family protein [Dehalococcoidales bacterium]
MRRWEEILPETDRALYQKLGYSSRQEYGTNPALLIIDVTRGFLGSRPMPVLQAVDEYRTSCGEAGWTALENIKKLLGACRIQKIPAIFTANDAVTQQFCVGPTKPSAGSPKTIQSKDLERRLKGYEIVDEIAPLSSELVIHSKTKANAFEGTPLLSCLQTMGIDCLLVAGCVTSVCVRATVVGAWSHGYPCFVVEECVFDKFELSHLVSLFDMNAKFADVITLEEALQYVAAAGDTSRQKS